MLQFRRYTNRAAAIHLLQTRTITLLNPATWDDKNDAYFMAEYKRLVGARTVLALCFAECNETYHHWGVFSHGSDGVCIVFDKERILSAFEGDALVRKGSVNYKVLNEIKKLKTLDAEELPFLKRRAYKDEKEYRVVYVNKRNAEEFLPYQIDIASVAQVILSPWIAVTLARAIRKTLLSIDGCPSLSITKSTLTNNEQWRRVTAKARIRSGGR